MEPADDRNQHDELPLPGSEDSGESDKDAERADDDPGNVSVGYGAGDTPGQEGIQDSLANEEEEISGPSDRPASPKQEPAE
jgi:hypothetical protein